MENMREFINIVKSLSYVRLKLLCNSNNRTTKRRKKNVEAAAQQHSMSIP